MDTGLARWGIRWYSADRQGWKDPPVLSPLEFIEKISAFIPPSKMHVTRFHGVFAANATWRRLIVDEGLGKLIEEKLGALAVGPVGPSLGLFVPKPARPKRELTADEKYTWATMLRRIYKIDLTICPDCKGRLRLRRKVFDSVEAKKIIEGLGLSIRPPPTKPSRVVTLDLD